MIYVLVKSNIIVDVKDLRTKMEQLTILKWDNNFHTLSTTIEELQQEINAKKAMISARMISSSLSFSMPPKPRPMKPLPWTSIC